MHAKRRHLNYLAALLCVAIAIPLFANNDTPEKPILHHNISLNLFSIIWGGFDFRYEYRYNTWLTFTVPADFEFQRLSPLPFATQQNLRTISNGFLPQAETATGFGSRFNYWGFYLEPMVKFGYAKIIVNPLLPAQNYFMLRPLFYLGYQKTFDFGLSLNVGFGPMYTIFFPRTFADSYAFLDVMLALGYAF